MSLLWYNSANQMTKPRMCGVCYCMTSWEKIRCGCCKKKHSICVSCHKSRYDFKRPQRIYEREGDGTVPGVSLNSPVSVHHWKVKKSVSIPGATHLGILNDKRWLDMIESLV